MKTIHLDDEDKTVCLELADEKTLKDIELGDEVAIYISGKVTMMKAPYESEDWSAECKPGKPRPMKMNPARLEVMMSTNPDVRVLSDVDEMLKSDENFGD